VGKTTLLKLILGQLEADAGRVRRGTQLQVAYFDQMRAGLNLDATLADTISPGSEWIEQNGSRKHVMGYLQDFLFSPERAHSPVRTLSGGERNRLLLARLFALPANVLVLDEPTNDLDIDTLELLEELLQSYPGTVFLVSHDRMFLDNVVTSLLAWEGDLHPGRWREYEGGIADWRAQRARMLAAQAAATPPRTGAAAVPAAPPAAPLPADDAGSQPLTAGAGTVAGAGAGTGASVGTTAAAAPAKARKRSFKEQREFDELPTRIQALEAEQKLIAERLASTDLYAKEPQAVPALQARYDEIDEALLLALERWEALS